MPADLVRRFLTAMEARDLTQAQSMLAEGFVMQFPGTTPMTTLTELLAWAAPRYKFVRKTYAGFDVVDGSSANVVYCHGTLSGEWPDGTAFSDIRFIDRFEVSGCRITRQDVWNDIADARAKSEPDGVS